MFSSEHDFTPKSPQYLWLEQTLQSVDRSIYPWIIFTMHRPAYTGNKDAGEQSVAAHLRLYLEPLWTKYKVHKKTFFEKKATFLNVKLVIFQKGKCGVDWTYS